MQNSYNRYGKLASRVYHLDKYIGRSFGDVEFYLERLKGCPGKVLEAAVGNGRVLIPLLEAGIDICGFDASADMLEFCEIECSKRGLKASVSRQTFADFTYGERFAAAIIPAGSFQLLADYDAALRFLRRLYDHLEPRGRLIFDVSTLEGLTDKGRSIRRWDDAGGETITLTSERFQTDYIQQTTLDLLRYELWRDSALIATELEYFGLRSWGIREMQTAMEQVGFSNITVSANYNHGVAPSSSEDMITFEAHRP